MSRLPPTSGRCYEQRHDEHPNEVAHHNTRDENHKIRHQLKGCLQCSQPRTDPTALVIEGTRQMVADLEVGAFMDE